MNSRELEALMQRLIETARPSFESQVSQSSALAIASPLEQSDIASARESRAEEFHPPADLQGERVRSNERYSSEELAPATTGKSGDLLLPLYGFESFLKPRQTTELPVISSESGTPTGQGDGSSLVSSVFKTAGLVSGVGPLVTGLIKLFGGGAGSQSEPAPLPQFSLPDSINLDAGLTSQGSIIPVEHGVSDTPRPIQSGSASPAATQIHVNVTAMDSRSFLDHSDDIARAVREAMLRSHSLNDIIAEI